MNKIWTWKVDAALVVFFVVYAIGYLTGTVEPSGFTAGMLALIAASSCARDAVEGKMKEKRND